MSWVCAHGAERGKLRLYRWEVLWNILGVLCVTGFMECALGHSDVSAPFLGGGWSGTPEAPRSLQEAGLPDPPRRVPL